MDNPVNCQNLRAIGFPDWPDKTGEMAAAIRDGFVIGPPWIFK
jgi:hypothetical protein